MGCDANGALTRQFQAVRARSGHQRQAAWMAAWGLAAAMWPAACPAQGFLKGLQDLGNAAARAMGASSQPAGASAPSGGTILPAASNAPPATAAQAVTAPLEKLTPSNAALAELRPDKQCTAVVENFDILQKAYDYAGTAAQLRLQTLIASNFAQSDLSPSDKQMLEYLAYTTVWIPTGVEEKIGKAWSAVAFKGSDQSEHSGRSERKALARQAARLEEMRAAFEGFPGNAVLVVDRDQTDGAYSRVGGIITLSQRFVSIMDDRDGVRDVLLAHELSHQYKRHALKALQYQLINSAQGWNISKKLIGATLAQSAKGNGNSVEGIGGVVDTVKMAFEAITLSKDVIDFVKANQTQYSVTQELEADACALRLLEKFSVDRRAAWVAFADVLTGPDASPTYQSVHPSPQERTDNITLMLGGTPDHMPPPGGTVDGPSRKKVAKALAVKSAGNGP